MDSKKIFIGLVLVLLFGLGTEVLKKFDLIGSRPPAEVETVSVAGMDLSPYHRNNKNDLVPASARRGSLSGFRLAQATTEKGGLDFGKDKKAAKDKSKKAKKKKKKKKVIAGTGKTPESNSVVVYEEADKEKKPNSALEKQPTAVAAVVPIQKPKDIASEQYQKWAALLLSGADREELSRFVREYQTGNVDINVFYQIVQEMFDKGTNDYMSLAVLAAGVTPSVRSFNFLTKAYAAQASGDEITAAIKAELNDYSVLQYIWVAGAAIQTTNDPFVAYIAATAFDTSTQRYITDSALMPTQAVPSDDTNLSDDDSARTPSSMSQLASARFFLQYRTALNAAAIRFQSEQEVTELLQRILERINKVELVAMNQVQ